MTGDDPAAGDGASSPARPAQQVDPPGRLVDHGTALDLAGTYNPSRGDVGVGGRPSLSEARFRTAADRHGDAWAVLTGDGVMVSAAQPLAAWRL